MSNCLNCGADIHKSKKFCNSSCSAKYNNAGRILSSETKLKISKSVQKTFSEKSEDDKAAIYEKLKGRRIFTRLKICTYCKKEFISKIEENGNYKTYCSDECFLEIKKHNAKGIKRQFYNGFKFDSNYEVVVAKFLDSISIIWEQVNIPILYVDNTGKTRKYFPDFYLRKYNIYLDPKNKFCIQQQKEKLDIVSKQIELIYGEPDYIIEYVKKLLTS